MERPLDSNKRGPSPLPCHCPAPFWCNLTSIWHLIEAHMTQYWRCVITMSAVAVGSEKIYLRWCFLGFWWCLWVVISVAVNLFALRAQWPFFLFLTNAEVSRSFFFFCPIWSHVGVAMLRGLLFLSRLSVFAYLEIKSVRSAPNSCDHKESTTSTLQRGSALTQKPVRLQTCKSN